jgi:hypothetical protein
MKIDVVYTWVNGADENWKRNKLEYSQKYNRHVSKEALSDARFMDNEELRYSIRSLFSYAPWINNIYIVTDNQIPEWLDSNCEKIKVIDHKEIFEDHNFLPTFNSMAIEANLHHIPNLSEYFLYFNDDVFLGDKCLPEYFFLKDGKPRIFVSDILGIMRKRQLNGKMLKKINIHQHTVLNCRKLLLENFGATVYTDIRHGAKACRKSDLFYLEKLFHRQLLNTMSHRFRDNDDVIIYYLASMYNLLNYTGKRTYVPSLSLKSRLLNYFNKKIIKYCFCYVHLGGREIDQYLSLIEKYRPFMFCINQYYDSPEFNIAKVRPFLEKYFPNSSPAEKSDTDYGYNVAARL